MLNSLKDFYRGPSFAIQGFAYLFIKGYRRYTLIPISLNILFFALIYYLLGNYVLNYYDEKVGQYTWANWWIVKSTLWLLMLVVGFFLTNTLFVFTINIIAIPFHTLIAAKVLRQQHVSLPSVSLKDDIYRTIKRELHKNVYFLPRFAIVLLTFVIPGINILSPMLWFLISCWVFSLQFVDYAAELQQISWPEVLQIAKKHRILLLSFGGMICVLISIPGLNILTPPAAVVAGSFMWYYMQRR